MLARTVAKLQSTVLQHARVAPTACEYGFLQGSVARFFGSGYLDRNQVTERILSSVKNFEKVDPNKVSTSSTFKDLGLDSLDTVEVVMAMEEEFSVEISDDDADSIHSIEQAVEYFVNHPHAK